MFRKRLISLGLLWCMMAFACFWVLHRSSPDAQIAYQRLINFSHEIKKEHLKEKAIPTQQMREKVSKQIFYKKDFNRLQSRLLSEHSDLILGSREDGGIELIEHFKGLTCMMQEALIQASGEEESSSSQNQQYVRYFKAQEAVYSYKTGQLDAEQVNVAHYVIPGILWPASLASFDPLMLGHAQKLQLSMFKEPTAKAQGFQATFHDWGNEW